VTGKVTDESGVPLAGIEITAHCGVGTLHGTGRTVTDEHGEYVLHFGPGYRYLVRESSGLQAATIAPRKPGFFERNLHRQGDLLMAQQPPGETERNAWGPHRTIVYPDQPQRVDFVMVPAAEVEGRLLDPQGRPIADHDVWLSGDEQPPSSSVIAAAKTDESGRFRITEVPTRPFWFAVPVEGRWVRGFRSEAIPCSAPGRHEVELVFEAGPAPRLTVRATSGP
jgi:hypothetical protein